MKSHNNNSIGVICKKKLTTLKPQIQNKNNEIPDGKVKIPSEIAKEIGMPQKHISDPRPFKKNHRLIECINPQVKVDYTD